MTTPYEMVSENFVRYEPASSTDLIEAIPWSHLLIKNYRFLGVKTSKTWMWFLLTVLKKLRGKEKFNETTGLLDWQGDLLMIYTPELDNMEIVQALNIAKDLLVEEFKDSLTNEYYVQIAKSLLYDIYCLHPFCRTLTGRLVKLPTLETISPEMDITTWF